MILQNIVWKEATEETEELYYRSHSKIRFQEKIVLVPETSFVTDTYMNLFDMDVWRKYTTVENVFLKLELQGTGQVILRTLEQNLKEVAIEFKCDKKQEIQLEVPKEWAGKVYFEIKANGDVVFYNACYISKEMKKMEVKLATIICTYKREQSLRNLLRELKRVKSVLKENLEVFVVDNASELNLANETWVHLYHNPNTGGSGGFGRGMDEVVRCHDDYASTHVLLMDDDVQVQTESILRLYALLSYMRAEYQKEIVAGRMFRMDEPWVQYTAAEIWNGGDLRHVGFELDMRKQENLWSINDNSGAEYSGWWFCCIPYEFVKDNRPLPFFLHCDDVEYGLRHGGTPIILNGIQVWHETYEYRQSPVVAYYDMRNSLFVNEIIEQKQGKSTEEMKEFYCQIFKKWKETILEYHLKEDWIRKYCVTLAVYDWLRGQKRLEKLNSNRLHMKLKRIKASKIKNALAWRCVEYRFKKFLRR